MANPYIPSFLRSALEGSKPLQMSFSDVSDTNIASKTSFLYDAGDTGLKNTQQLNVDWSKFENHTFFSSAEAKVNLSFDQIINGYPFDGSRAEVEAFFEKLTGFDRYVFDNFPKFKGQLHFSGTQVGEDVDGTLGTWISIKDHAGSLYPEISKNKTGDSIVNPKNGVSFTIEAQVFVPSIINDTQVIFQKIEGDTEGIALYLVPSATTTDVEVRFTVMTGADVLTASATILKGRFNHLCVTLNRESGVDYLEFFVNEVLENRTKASKIIADLDIDSSNVLIGSGTKLTLSTGNIIPTQTFSGSIDEFRVFHSVRTVSQQELFAKKAIYATPELKLYYRFNEPNGTLASDVSDSVNSIVLDSSGNSLHALISNFDNSLRQNAYDDPTSLMIYEKPETLPVLFPAYADVIALNTTLLSSASKYDIENPNLITRLVPQHYLRDGAFQDGTGESDEFGNSSYGGSGIPGQGQLSPSQIIVSFLYIWARFFDEMKLYIDNFSSLQFLDYAKTNNSPDNFLNDLVKIYGFNLPPLFNTSNIDQYINAENIGLDISTSTLSLKAVQNELLRRVLINMPDVIRSKGTQHAIRSFLRAVGIDPDNSLRIREFGGPTTRQLSFSRERRADSGAMVEFATGSFCYTPFLSASRVEVGFPSIAGSMVTPKLFPPHGISDNSGDGLLTSGSWTVEGIYKYTPGNIQIMTNATQSLARLCVTGSNGSAFVANLLAISSSIDPKILLYVRPGAADTSPVLRMSIDLPLDSFFNSSKWSVCFGCQRNDDGLNSRVSSSYFLRIATQDSGDIGWNAATSSYFHENPTAEAHSLRSITVDSPSGSYLAVGENQITTTGGGPTILYLNNTLAAPEEARTTAFTGRVSNFRFWSRALSPVEWNEHIRSYKSLGVQDPLTNYNFVKTASGSFGRVRLDTFTKQYDRYSNTDVGLGPIETINFLDYSLNNNHMTGSGFPIDQRIVVGEIFDYSYLSPYFDEASTSEKIRIRGYQNQALVDATPWAGVSPVHEIVRSERPTDDVRLSIEFSLIDSLNRDIVTMFSTFDAIDNAIGSPELLYSPDYPDLDRLREVYFNRISKKINYQEFFEFFRWFDRSLGTFIEQLVPRKTRFKGVNFVIESHMLERNKLEHLTPEIYLGEEDRSRIRSVLLLQFIEGTIRKY